MSGIPNGFDFNRAKAAEYLGLGIKTLDDWAYKRKNLPYAVIGNRAWYRRSDVDALIRRQMRKVRPDPTRRDS